MKYRRGDLVTTTWIYGVWRIECPAPTAVRLVGALGYTLTPHDATAQDFASLITCGTVDLPTFALTDWIPTS